MYTTFEEIASRLHSEFGIDADDYFVRTHSIQALNEMGMIQTENHVIHGTIKNQSVHLDKRYTRINWVVASSVTPPSFYGIEALHFPRQDFFVPIPSATEEDLKYLAINGELKINNIPGIKGPYLSYSLRDGCLHFNVTDRSVLIYAECLALDKNNLPLIPEEALEACVHNCAYIWFKPMFILGKIHPQVFREIERWMHNRFSQCQNRAGFRQLNQNAMDNVFEVATSMDRKAFGINS